MSPGTVNPSMKSRKRQTARGKPKNNVSKAKKTSGKSIQTKTIRRPIKTTRMKKKPKKVGKPKVKVTNANKNIQIIFDPDSFDDDMLKKMFTMDSINYSYKWELKYLRKIPILANITPNIENFTIIKDTLFERFLPNTPKYDHIEVNSIVSNENYSVKTLDLFNWDQINFQFNSSYIINCGGPVWGLDWCPFTNCLLLSTHKNINEENLINESSTLEPGLIQVYPFDSSTNG
ncbi:hypothetical protein RF11_01782 [Thelohanellus kitauei]|uniref:Uncharacterized protein n=1 Tax=Thelohanellus kitauei TaxID=669202 RepID=A0A0C2MU99_THEKT|nr:hypothetical protein RF11_01782 [Thelohanellus kitauei]